MANTQTIHLRNVRIDLRLGGVAAVEKTPQDLFDIREVLPEKYPRDRQPWDIALPPLSPPGHLAEYPVRWETVGVDELLVKIRLPSLAPREEWRSEEDFVLILRNAQVNQVQVEWTATAEPINDVLSGHLLVPVKEGIPLRAAIGQLVVEKPADTDGP